MEQARNKALVEAQFLRQALAEEGRGTRKRGNGHNIHTKEAWEVVILKGMLKVAEKTIEGLKNTIDKSRQESRELQSKLSMNETQLGLADLQL